MILVLHQVYTKSFESYLFPWQSTYGNSYCASYWNNPRSN